MTRVCDIYETLCALAPLELQLGFDNAGFLVGRREAPVSRALLALDITDWVIDEAIEQGAQLIIAHHPVIWGGLKSVTDDPHSRKILRMLEQGVAGICMHTNLDIAQGGVNDALMAALGAHTAGGLDQDNCGRYGYLDAPLALGDFLARCKGSLSTNGLRYVDAGRSVYKLAVMGGAGGDALEEAIAKGCDTYVTADIKYHQFLEAAERGINLIDADHFCTENPVIPVLAEKLRAAFPEVAFSVSQRHGPVIRFF